ncbi:ead/Ea22-like family protein [Enterobacter cloacae complex sp. 372C4]|uniref:ead/Ea22-like family protein n=1 Tax=unclassified Enterobacter cloacae complex TaxID=2757714 RepID=UPI003CE9518F
MSNINKQGLREAAERAESDSWGYDRDEFNEALTPSTVLALLDELEAKDSMIAAQQHEIRTLLNALEGRPCPKCNDTGMADSGGTQPWGEPISVPCDCAAPPAPVSVPDAIHSQGEKSASDDYYALGWNACRAAMLKHSEPFIVTSDHRMMEMPQVEAINAVTAILQGADGALTNEDTKSVGELVMWVKRLAHSLRKANPDSKLQSDAMDYLSRKGLIGVEDILR